MPVAVIDVLGTRRGLVVAPAGCGKTELIVETIRAHEGRPALVLTHTNAGVFALRERLSRGRVASGKCRLTTIDGWALRVVRTYPQRADYHIDLSADIDYPQIRAAAIRLVESGALDDSLPASYGRLLIDEYQDCSIQQHALANALAARLPTCVFGDPLQAIFGFNADPLIPWPDIEAAYPLLGELDIPWRWRNARADDLGAWLIRIRPQLRDAVPIDLTGCPGRVIWRRLTGNPNADRITRMHAHADIPRAANERILIVGHAAVPHARHEYARHSPGVSVVEPVELSDMIGFARTMENLRGEALLTVSLELASTVMAGVNAGVLRTRVGIIQRGRSRSAPTSTEQAALRLAANGGLPEAALLLRQLYESPGTRMFRARMFAAILEALDGISLKQGRNLVSSAIAVREQRRHSGRRLPLQAIGSTLLLKGLESEYALILDGDGMNAHHLYVALSRAARSVTVLSRSAVLDPDL